MGMFDTILGNVEEADRAVLLKYPDLRSAMETLETQKAELSTKVTDLDGKVRQWDGWAKENWDAAAGMPKAEKQLRDQNASLKNQYETEKARAEALAAMGDSDMTFADIEKELLTRGYVRKEDIPAVVSEHVKPFAKREEVQNALTDLDNGMATFAVDMLGVPDRHYREFGEEFNTEKFMEFYHGKKGADNKLPRPREAYNMMVAEKRDAARTAAEKKAKEDQDAALAAARKAGEEEGMKRAAAAGHPADLGAPPPGASILRRRPLDDQGQPVKTAGGPGDFAKAAAEAADEFRKARAAGTSIV